MICRLLAIETVFSRGQYMSTPLPTTAVADFQLTSASRPAAEPPVCSCDEATTGADFKDLMADESLLAGVVTKLKQLLPEDEFAKITEMLESGNELPLAAIFSPESELLTGIHAAIPQAMQELARLDSQITTTLTSSAQRLGEGIGQQFKDASARTMDNLGRQVGETLTSLTGDDSPVPGKQIQELLLAVKGEFAAKDGIPRALAGSEAIPNINSAINGLAQISNLQASTATTQPPAIAAPMGEQGWSQAMGDRIMWMLGKGMQAASIRINPPHLGPVQVQLSVQNDQASVNMVAQHGVVKEALEAALPRLREMLAESNLQLVNVDVSHRENPQHGSRSEMSHQDHTDANGDFPPGQEEMAQAEDEPTRYYTSSGLLDDYA
jgi:flagellar hook-length control protein FliK